MDLILFVYFIVIDKEGNDIITQSEIPVGITNLNEAHT